jgi:pyrroloquinoline-quinone synthase
VSAPEAWSSEEFEARLRAVGAERYHHLHPFNLRMHQGTLTPEEIRTWVANRYYYQTRIPIKDARIIAKAQDQAFRREWIERIHDHDGTTSSEGGLELWLTLADAVGLERAEVASLEHVLPGVRRACDAYVEFVDAHDLLESVASSLTEMFSSDIMHARIAAFEKHYRWVRTEGLRYFQSRTTQAPADAAFGLAYVIREARSRADQERCVAALERKCEILWSLLDAIEAAHGRPRLSRHALLRVDEQDAGALVVLPERGVKIGGSGREIVALCDGVRTTRELVAALRERHPEAAGLEEDVYAFVDQMLGLGVLELAEAAPGVQAGAAPRR